MFRLGLVLLLLSSPGLLSAEDETEGLPVRSLSRPERARVVRLAQRIVEAVQRKDAARLALATHPEKGVRLHSAIDLPLAQTVRFSRPQMRKFFHDERVYAWGPRGESDEIIRLQPRDFHRQYLAGRDFSRASSITLNPRRGPGTAIGNLGRTYPRAIRIAFFVPARAGLMDWQQLIVVLEPYHGGWRLVALVHNEWTI